MSRILTDILNRKRESVALRKTAQPSPELAGPHYHRQPLSFKDALLQPGSTGIIAEFKRRSPSKGWIKEGAVVEEIVTAYAEGGAAAISVLTEEDYFGGSDADLLVARAAVNIPLLRKDFVVDAYQIHEAKALGADAVLLIAAALSKEEVAKFSMLAKSLGLSVLFEVHSALELAKFHPSIDVVGVNNRDLNSFNVSLRVSEELSEQIRNVVKISESGIFEPAQIHRLRWFGYVGFLIGENFMRESNTALHFQQFVKRTNDYLPVKVCGITTTAGVEGVVDSGADWMGFIFAERSPRYVEKFSDLNLMRKAGQAKAIGVGVFVNATVMEIQRRCTAFQLQAVQLHGDERRELCAQVRQFSKVIKAFSVEETSNIDELVAPYEGAIDYYLFDTKTHAGGGSGQKWNWSILKTYTGSKPYILSGGISAEDVELIRQLPHPRPAVIDINSRFETSPGVKDFSLVKKFIHDLRS